VFGRIPTSKRWPIKCPPESKLKGLSAAAVSGRPTAEWRAQTPRRFGNFLWPLSSSVADIVGTGRTGDRTAFFGMANDTVASIEVIWPGGARQLVRDIYRSIKPDALVEWCPCGTAFNVYTLPNLNMSVASDPHNSWQVRTKGKTLKALHGDATAYFGDHVELSDGRQDFASTVGVGGVVGTQFTWPTGSGRNNRLDLTAEKEQIWQKWISLYNEKRLSQGEYRGDLYDIGFDRPEAHAIRKAGSMYYAFFAPQWQGKVELRGLDRRVYTVRDYENGKTLGTVRGPAGAFDVQFQAHLLLEAKPE
jgi:hypothetical protein